MSIKQSVGTAWKVLFLLFWLFGGYGQNLAARECVQGVARAVSIQGRVELKNAAEPNWRVVRQGDRLCRGDHLRVGPNGRAGLVLHDESMLRLSGSSEVRFSAPTKEGNTLLELLQGITHVISRISRPLQVDTPHVNAFIEGTEFTIEAYPDSARVTVLEGKVTARNEHGEVVITDGQQVDTRPGEPPRSAMVVNPRDAVQWAIYYPPVIEPPAANASEAVKRSLAAYRRGDLNSAFGSLAEEPGVMEDVDLLVYRAALHLQVGRIEAAREDLAAVLDLQPEQADALALMSLIATVNNDYRQATDLARRALEADAQSPSAYLARSYAQQARFQLFEAWESATEATVVAPENALAWARLAQLELMLRNLDASAEAAGRAVEIAPGHAQSQTTLGFARLIRFDLEGARKAFERACILDQASPQPRLGLGLVWIREGDLAGGRRQLEIAANLDPGNALVRSYLGKAYYEEKRNSLAATQFALAKQFDELDPTAWFYDAIRKQAENRPVEALKDIQTSIDLNDNRAVYRSRLMLDQDEAARGASQARIYQDLGFDQLARAEAYNSLQTSVHNHSAHRLLADSYSGRPRYEKARLSELLQSQLLQPLNTTPIQPQLAVSNLGILDGAGPSAGGFSEYTPLFTREGLNLQLNAIGGNDNTGGDDLLLSGLKDKISFSLGQFHYETDGWRENSDLQQDIYDAFLQYSISPATSIQFEYRQQDAESGDLGLKFDPEKYSPYVRDDLERRFGRIGLYHQFTSGGQFIASAAYQDKLKTRTENKSENISDYPTPFGTLSGTYRERDITTKNSISSVLELQYIQHLGDHAVSLGTGYYDEEYARTNTISSEITFPLPETSDVYIEPIQEPIIDRKDIDPRFKNIYIYSRLALPAEAYLTIGAAFEDFESSIAENDNLGAKFGLSWDLTSNLTLRTAYIESIVRPLQFEQTIEPTQVAGFNQYFDDVEGTEVQQTGIGADVELTDRLGFGVELYRRELEVPHMDAVGQVKENVDDEILNGYFYWAATDRIGLRAGYEKEKLKRQFEIDPKKLSTSRTPIGLSYHWPSGLFLDFEGNRIDQEITQNGITEQDSFWNVDAVLGYRLPKRIGKVEIIVKNMLDEEFNYYDLSFHSNENVLSQFQPERQLFLRFLLNF